MIDRTEFQPQAYKSTHGIKPLNIAPVADRFLATAFDFVIFTPVVGLMLAPLFRRLELISMSSPQSTEFTVLAALAVFYICILSCLLQTLFLVWKKATPGQLFFKLRVVSVDHPEKHLSLTQSLLRSVLWTFEFFLLLLPFLEVFSDQQRRPLHDRAAGTMVITLKKDAEIAPHQFEAELVRKVMALSFMLLFFWGLTGVSHFYRMAMRGEFKRSELIANNYLCEEVSRSLDEEDAQNDGLRIDKAVGLYLASEVSDDCVLSEADFALWSSSDEGADWAYFAKGLIKKYDRELAASYFEQACQSNDQGAACELAKIHQGLLGAGENENVDPSDFSEQVKETETAQVLSAVYDFEQARYAEAEKRFVSLKETKGYTHFAQKGLIKSLWAQNKKEKAEGAFLGSLLQENSSEQRDVMAWLCLEQLDDQCSPKSKQACESLKEQYVGNLHQVENPLVAVALIKEKDCRKSTDMEIARFHELFKEYPDVLTWTKAVTEESNLSSTERLDLLRELSFRKTPVRPQVVRTQALQTLAEKSLRKSDIELVMKSLDSRKIKDLAWDKVFNKMKNRNLPTVEEDRQPASLKQDPSGEQ